METEKVAILVDGGFYQRRAKALWGDRTAKERAIVQEIEELLVERKKNVNKEGSVKPYQNTGLQIN